MSVRPPGFLAEREAVLEAMRELDRLGLNHGTSGNVGLRVAGGVLVTPTAMPSHVCEPADIVLLGPDGSPVPGERRLPTSEWRIHVDVLARRLDVDAVVHTHSTEATAVAARREPLRAVHYAIARAGGPEVPCAAYATYGTPELSANVLAALGDRLVACLMANHGLVALGRDLGSAVSLAVELEWLAAVDRRARTNGEPVVLPDAEIERVVERFRGYRQG